MRLLFQASESALQKPSHAFEIHTNAGQSPEDLQTRRNDITHLIQFYFGFMSSQSATRFRPSPSVGCAKTQTNQAKTQTKQPPRTNQVRAQFQPIPNQGPTKLRPMSNQCPTKLRPSFDHNICTTLHDICTTACKTCIEQRHLHNICTTLHDTAAPSSKFARPRGTSTTARHCMTSTNAT